MTTVTTTNNSVTVTDNGATVTVDVGSLPALHAASHASGGSDPVTLAQSQVTSLVSDLAGKAPTASPTFTGTPVLPAATTLDGFAFAAAFTAYTPAWTSAGTQPALGNGTLVGYYTRIGKLCIGGFVLTMGTTTTYGTSVYYMSLPLPFQGTSAGRMLSNGSIYDSSVGTLYPITGRLNGSAALNLMSQTSPIGFIDPTTPITFATGDVIDMMFCYEVD